MLYEITRDGHAIYLTGGWRPTTEPWSSPAIEALAASAEEFWNEVPVIGPEAQALAPRYGIDPVAPLATWLSTDDASRVAAAAEAAGANAALLAPLRPWLAAQVLRIAFDARAGLAHAHSVEAVLTRRATEAGVPVKSEFGTPEGVFASFASMPPEAEVQYLRFTLYEIESGVPRVDEHAAAMARGDLGPIERETAMMREEWPALYAHLVVERNRAWLPRIDSMMLARTRAFIVVGTGHLVGEDGLLALLPRAGYAVRRAHA